jgi:hypothetical protein
MPAGDGELYVYALAESGLPRTMRVLGHTLHALPVGAVYAIVERHPDRAQPTTEGLQEQHAIVANLAARGPALLPARFGSRIDGRALREMIAQRQSTILESLARVRGRRQMTLRVFGAVQPAAAADTRAATGTAFLKSRQSRAHEVPPEVRSIRDALGSLAEAERVERGEGGLRVTVFHLMSVGNVESYKKKAAALQLGPHSLTVSGPWPPFAFAPELF